MLVTRKKTETGAVLFPMLFGQSVVIFIVLSAVCQNILSNSKNQLLIPVLELSIYLIIFTFSISVIKYKRLLMRRCCYAYVLSGFLDFLYSFATMHSFRNLDTSIIIYVEQLVYPMVIIADKVFYNKRIKKKRLGFYICLITIYFCYNLSKQSGKIKAIPLGILYILFANFLEISNSYIQLYITGKTNYLIFLMYTSFWSVVFRLIFIAKKIIFDNLGDGLLEIVVDNILVSLAYVVAYIIFFKLSMFYIEMYSCSSLYAQTITSNLYLTCFCVFETITCCRLIEMLVCFIIALFFAWIEIPKIKR